MATVTRYPTRPMATSAKLRELRRRLNRESWEVRGKGGVVVAGGDMIHPIIAGVGSWARRLFGPYFATAMRDPATLLEYHGVADARGFPRGEMCSSLHHLIGQVLLGLTTTDPYNGGKSPVDLVFEVQFCPSLAKLAQIVSEQLDVPLFILEVPHQGDELSVQYVVNRMHDSIDFLTRVTGREYNDDLLIEGTKNWWDQYALLSRIYSANKAVPAPLDYQLMHAFMVPGIVAPHLPEVPLFYEEVLAEVEERVRDGISVHGVETARFTHEGEPPYYAEDFIPELVRRYGGVLVGGWTNFCQGLWEVSTDGRWTPVPRFRDLGLSLQTREDALRLLARGLVLHHPMHHLMRLEQKASENVHRARDWRCDGVIFHLDIGCRSQAAGVLGAREALRDAGIPSVMYQASSNDARDFSPGQVSDPLESFFERLGLEVVK